MLSGVEALTTSQTVSTVQAFTAGAAADGDMTTHIARGSIALHTTQVVVAAG